MISTGYKVYNSWIATRCMMPPQQHHNKTLMDCSKQHGAVIKFCNTAWYNRYSNARCMVRPPLQHGINKKRIEGSHENRISVPWVYRADYCNNLSELICERWQLVWESAAWGLSVSFFRRTFLFLRDLLRVLKLKRGKTTHVILYKGDSVFRLFIHSLIRFLFR